MVRLPSVRPPSPKDIGSRLRRRMRIIRYGLADLLYLLGSIPRAIGRGFAEFWRDLSVKTRQRFVLAVAGAVAVSLLIFVAVPALPCQAPGAERCPPDDDAAELVPADSLAYAHVNVDPETDQYEDAKELAKRVPLLSQQLSGRLLAQVPGPSGAPPVFAEDIEPWFGGEAAVAVLPKGRNAEQAQLLEVSDSKGALAFAEEISSGAPAVEEYRGVEIRVDDRGLATALVGDFLVIATTESGVRSVVELQTAAEGARSLAADPVAEGIRERLPDHRLGEIYLSRDGIADYVAEGDASLASLEPFVNARAAGGAALAVIAGEGDLEVAIRSALEPQKSKAQPGFFGAFPGFDSSLAAVLDDDTLGYVGIGDPERTMKRLLTQASADAPGLAAGFSDLSKRLRDLGKVDVEKDLLPSLGGEAAFSLQPGPGREEKTRPDQDSTPVPGIEGGPAPSSSGAPVPFLSVIANEVDEKAAKEALARLQGPIAEALKSSDIQAPVFNREEVGGVQAQSLRVSPTVNLTYAIIDSLLVVATDPLGVAEVAGGEGGLSETDRFEATTEGLEDEDPSLLAYFNLNDLVRIGEREGLSEDPAYASFASELRRLLGLGLAIRSADDALDTDARITVAEAPEEAEEEQEAPPPVAPASD